MPAGNAILQVYKTGPLTVVGFGGERILDHVSIADCRAEVTQLVQDSGCETLAFDLTGVTFIPSGLLGLLNSLRDLGIAVHVYNPSDDVREAFEMTRLDQLIPIHDVEL